MNGYDQNPLVYGGVFGIVLGAALALGVFLDVGDSGAQNEPQAEESVVDRYMDRPAVNVEVPEDSSIFIDEVVIEAMVPSHLATSQVYA